MAHVSFLGSVQEVKGKNTCLTLAHDVHGRRLGWMFVSCCTRCRYCLVISEFDGCNKMCKYCIEQKDNSRANAAAKQKEVEVAQEVAQWATEADFLPLKPAWLCEPGRCHAKGCNCPISQAKPDRQIWEWGPEMNGYRHLCIVHAEVRVSFLKNADWGVGLMK